MKHSRETWKLLEAASDLLVLGAAYPPEHVRAAREYLESKSTDDPSESRLKQAIVAFLRECEEL